MANNNNKGKPDKLPVAAKVINQFTNNDTGMMLLGGASTLIWHLNEMLVGWKSCGWDFTCKIEKVVLYLTMTFGVQKPSVMAMHMFKRAINNISTKISGKKFIVKESNWEWLLMILTVFGISNYALNYAWKWVKDGTACLKENQCENDNVLIWIGNMKIAYCSVNMTVVCNEDEENCVDDYDRDDDEIEKKFSLCDFFYNELPLIFLGIVTLVFYIFASDNNDDEDDDDPPEKKQSTQSLEKKDDNKDKKNDNSLSKNNDNQKTSDKSEDQDKKGRNGDTKKRDDLKRKEEGKGKENESTKKVDKVSGNDKSSNGKAEKNGNNTKESASEKDKKGGESKPVDAPKDIGKRKLTNDGNGHTDKTESSPKNDTKNKDSKNDKNSKNDVGVNTGDSKKDEGQPGNGSSSKGGKSQEKNHKGKNNDTCRKSTKQATLKTSRSPYITRSSKSKHRTDKSSPVQEIVVKCVCNDLYTRDFPDPLEMFCQECSRGEPKDGSSKSPSPSSAASTSDTTEKTQPITTENTPKIPKIMTVTRNPYPASDFVLRSNEATYELKYVTSYRYQRPTEEKSSNEHPDSDNDDSSSDTELDYDSLKTHAVEHYDELMASLQDCQNCGSDRIYEEEMGSSSDVAESLHNLHSETDQDDKNESSDEDNVNNYIAYNFP